VEKICPVVERHPEGDQPILVDLWQAPLFQQRAVPETVLLLYTKNPASRRPSSSPDSRFSSVQRYQVACVQLRGYQPIHQLQKHPYPSLCGQTAVEDCLHPLERTAVDSHDVTFPEAVLRP